MISAGNVQVVPFDLFSATPGLSCVATSRLGGVSRPPYAGLNLAEKTGDRPDCVAANWKLVRNALGLDNRTVVLPEQIHGTRVEVVADSSGCAGLPAPDSLGRSVVPGTDALVTARTDVALATVGADCPLAAVYDPKQRALGVFHSGWRGTLGGIGAATVDLMRDQLGCRARDLLAVISPSIGPCCYEVCPEFVEFAADSCKAFGDCVVVRGRLLYFDLWRANEIVLETAGLDAGNVEVARICTSCEVERFYSHRASGAPTGRHALLAWMR